MELENVINDEFVTGKKWPWNQAQQWLNYTALFLPDWLRYFTEAEDAEDKSKDSDTDGNPSQKNKKWNVRKKFYCDHAEHDGG